MTIEPTPSACQGVGTRWAQASPGASSHQGGGGDGLQGSRHCIGAFNQEEGGDTQNMETGGGGTRGGREGGPRGVGLRTSHTLQEGREDGREKIGKKGGYIVGGGILVGRVAVVVGGVVGRKKGCLPVSLIVWVVIFY